MPADSAMLAAVRDTVVGLPEGQSRGSLAPAPQPRRATSDQASNSHHAHSYSLSSARPSDRSSQAAAGRDPHARSPSAHALPASSSSSRDPFSDKSRPGASNASLAAGEKKKGSRHADAIDKLDPSNFWGGMLHHESAYDAAAPSRNAKTSRNAARPMGAFDEGAEAAPAGAGGKHRGLSALANRTLEKMGSIKFSDETKGDGAGAGTGAGGGGPHSAPASGVDADSYFDVLPTIPSTGAAGAASAADDEATTPRLAGGAIGRGLKLIRSRSRDRKNSGGDKGRIPGVGNMPDEDDYLNARAKEKKNALANAWGVADPEPFEDFTMAAATSPRGDTGLASAASSIWKGHERHIPPPPEREASAASANKYSLTESYAADTDGAGEEVLAAADVNTGTYGSTPSGGAGVKRSKSLMQRIRNMRENPNVPLAPEGKPASPGGTSPSSLPNSASYSTFAAAQQQQRRGIFARQSSARSDHSGTSIPGPSPSSEGSFVLVPPSADTTPRKPVAQQQQQQQHGRERSRSDLLSSSASSGSLNQRDKSLPRLPPAADLADDDPFSDALERKPSPVRRPSDQHLSVTASHAHAHQAGPQAALGRPLGRTRSPVPPPAPIDLPGQDQSGLYPSRFADRSSDGPGTTSSGGGSGGGGGGAALGRKGSLMKRVLGRG